jgi:hypothetical protein
VGLDRRLKGWYGCQNMNDNQTRSSANTEPQLLLESGSMLLRDFNPKGVLRFAGRKCVTCGSEIMDHWLRPNDDPDLRAEYWCTKDGFIFSQGIADSTWDVPEGFGR